MVREKGYDDDVDIDDLTQTSWLSSYRDAPNSECFNICEKAQK